MESVSFGIYDVRAGGEGQDSVVFRELDLFFLLRIIAHFIGKRDKIIGGGETRTEILVVVLSLINGERLVVVNSVHCVDYDVCVVEIIVLKELFHVMEHCAACDIMSVDYGVVVFCDAAVIAIVDKDSADWKIVAGVCVVEVVGVVLALHERVVYVCALDCYPSV